MQTTFKIWLESEEHDYKFRQEAEIFFSKLKKYILDNVYRIHKLPFQVVSTDEAISGYVIKGDIIDPKHNRFAIAIISVDNQHSMAHDPEEKTSWILIPLLEPYSYDEYNPGHPFMDKEHVEEIEYRLDSFRPHFVHEFIHYLDYERYKDSPEQLEKRMRQVYQHSQTDDPRYFLNPSEYNAFYQDGISSFVDNWKSMNDEEQDKLTSNFEKFKNEVVKHLDWRFATTIIQSGEKWKKKLFSRIYSLFVSMKLKSGKYSSS